MVNNLGQIPAPPDPGDFAALIGWICVALLVAGFAGLAWLAKWFAGNLEKNEQRHDIQNTRSHLVLVGVSAAVNGLTRSFLAHDYTMSGILSEDLKNERCAKMREKYERLQLESAEQTKILDRIADELSKSLNGH